MYVKWESTEYILPFILELLKNLARAGFISHLLRKLREPNSS